MLIARDCKKVCLEIVGSSFAWMQDHDVCLICITIQENPLKGSLGLEDGGMRRNRKLNEIRNSRRHYFIDRRHAAKVILIDSQSLGYSHCIDNN